MSFRLTKSVELHSSYVVLHRLANRILLLGLKIITHFPPDAWATDLSFQETTIAFPGRIIFSYDSFFEDQVLALSPPAAPHTGRLNKHNFCAIIHVTN